MRARDPRTWDPAGSAGCGPPSAPPSAGLAGAPAVPAARGWWVTVALLGAALAAAGPAAAAMAGTPALAAVLLVEQLAFGWAWAAVLRASRPVVALLAAAAFAADGAVLGAARHSLGSMAGVVGAGLAIVIVYQLFRRRHTPVTPPAADAAPSSPARTQRVTAELTAALGGGTLVAFLAGLLALRAEPGLSAPGELLVAVGLAGTGGAVLAGWVSRLLGAGPLLAGGVGLAVGTGLGAGYGALADELSAPSGALLAAAGALAAAVMSMLISRAGAPAATTPATATSDAPTSDAPLVVGAPGLSVRTGSVAAALVAAVAPLAVAAPLVYLVGRHLPG